MTKKEKKEIIKKLILDIQGITDIDEYSEKRSQLFHEVISAGYPDQSYQGVVKAADMWCKDMDRNMEAKITNQKPPNDEQFIALSAVGLLTLIDTSLLPD